MINDSQCKEYLEFVRAFSNKIGLNENFESKLNYLDNYFDREKTVCQLYKDFAPYSFYFIMHRKTDNGLRQWFNGGMIFHGQHDGYGSGQAPAYSVTLEKTNGWSIHT